MIVYFDKELQVKKPHKHAELIKAWADGAEIQLWWNDQWVDSENPNWVGEMYRIKPELKPDVVKLSAVYLNEFGDYILKSSSVENLKLTFDGETGELKSAEVLK